MTRIARVVIKISPISIFVSETRLDNRFDKSSMSTPSVLTMILCLAASGCAGLNASDSPPQPLAALQPPDGKILAELVRSAFKKAELPGAPEVSPVRAAHDAQWGDWVFCIKSSGSEQLPKYAVLVSDDTILEIRSFVMIDGCDKETYHPIKITDQHDDLDKSTADLPIDSRRRHQMKAQ